MNLIQKNQKIIAGYGLASLKDSQPSVLVTNSADVPRLSYTSIITTSPKKSIATAHYSQSFTKFFYEDPGGVLVPPMNSLALYEKPVVVHSRLAIFFLYVLPNLQQSTLNHSQQTLIVPRSYYKQRFCGGV